MVGKSYSQPQDTASLAHSMTARSSTVNHNLSGAPSESTDDDRDEVPSISPVPAPSGALKTWSFPLVALLACTMTGGTAAIAFLSLTALPPEADCTQSVTVETDRGLLYCVQQAAQSGDLDKVLEGLNILGQWTTADPLYYEAQSSIEKWSRTVLVTARQKLLNDELDDAIALVEKVPYSSPLYDEAQNLLASWQNQSDQAKVLVANAQEALKQQKWDQVSQQIKALGELTAYAERSEHIRQISAQLRLEKENNAIFQQVLQLAKPNTPQAIGLALEAAGTINQETYVWASAQSALEPLAKRLLTYGGLQWQQSHLDNAIVTAQRVAIFDSLAPEARNLETLSQARKLAIATVTNWVPSQEHLFNLLEATAAVRQIPASSQFYAQAQDSLNSWEAQFSDVSHLQLAKISAQLGWEPAVAWAATQAEQLSPERPRRVQAQTLAAHWHLELERIKDRRYLIWANRLAEPGTRASLKMAITEAEKVQRDRPLFGEAQGLIYAWTREIQTQEDQPYLTLAESLARQGELREAIQTARLIQPNRPLHNTARAAINQWQQDIWAQQRAEQQRLARRTRTRRVQQSIATTSEEPTTKLVSNPTSPAVDANGPATSASIPHKSASSPPAQGGEAAITTPVSPPVPAQSTELNTLSPGTNPAVSADPLRQSDVTQPGSGQPELGPSESAQLESESSESTQRELGQRESGQSESAQLEPAPVTPSPTDADAPTPISSPSSDATFSEEAVSSESEPVRETPASEVPVISPAVPSPSPVVPAHSEPADTVTSTPEARPAPVAPVTPAPAPASNENVSTSDISTSFNLDTTF